MKQIKLKPITERIAVATPTEEEAVELLAILHANGYKWYCGDSLIKQNYWYKHKHESAYSIKSNKSIGFSSCGGYKVMGVKILSLAEFVVEYVDIKSICDEIFVAFTKLQNDMRYVCKPQPTEDMEASGETGKNSKKSQLNLCELLQGHEGDEFYSLIAGKCRLKEINEGAAFPICIILDACAACEYLTKDGKRFNVSAAGCMLFPSRALYEQYPLDPYTAWMVWQEEQKPIHYIEVHYGEVNGIDKNLNEVLFHTPSDRDKCVEEIKAIIEKYSKK